MVPAIAQRAFENYLQSLARLDSTARLQEGELQLSVLNWLAIWLSIVGGAALKAIIPAMEAAFDAIKRSAYSHIIEKNKVRISLPEACIVVDACPAAGLRLTDAEFTKIIRNVFSFIDSEENMLAEFNEILVPWDMNEVLSNLDRLALRIRAYDKWRITFKDGLCSVYDSFLKRWVG